MESANLRSDGSAIERMLTVLNQAGIHARPAAMIVRVTNRFNADVFFEKDDEQVNAKSIMGLMMLAAGKNSQIKAIAEGADANELLDELEILFASKFDDK